LKTCFHECRPIIVQHDVQIIIIPREKKKRKTALFVIFLLNLAGTPFAESISQRQQKTPMRPHQPKTRPGQERGGRKRRALEAFRRKIVTKQGEEQGENE
jgi:D-lyxose ketol-isomerase